MAKFHVELRLLGPDVSPETVDVEELFALITKYKTAVLETAKTMQQPLNSDEERMALVRVAKGSDRLRLAVDKTLARPVREVSIAVRSNDWSRCGPDACKSISDVSRLLRHRNWELELPSGGRGAKPVLRGDTAIIAPPTYVANGETVLYGTVDDAGREKSPRLRLILADGTPVDVTGPRDDIKRLGTCLFDEVALRGVATWNLDTGRVTHFRLTGIEEFRETSLIEAFENLASVAGSNWDQVDAKKFVRDLRGHGK
jgi:hypothetical protein